MKLIITSIVIAALGGCRGNKEAPSGGNKEAASAGSSSGHPGSSDQAVFMMRRVGGVRMASRPLGPDRHLFLRVDAIWECEGTSCVREGAAALCATCAGKECDCAKPSCASVCKPSEPFLGMLANALAAGAGAGAGSGSGQAPAGPIPPFGIEAIGNTTLVSLPVSATKHVLMQVGGTWACRGGSCAAESLYLAGCDCRLTACNPVCRPRGDTTELAPTLPGLGEADPPL